MVACDSIPFNYNLGASSEAAYYIFLMGTLCAALLRPVIRVLNEGDREMREIARHEGDRIGHLSSRLWAKRGKEDYGFPFQACRPIFE